jgi:hypothetical protein
MAQLQMRFEQICESKKSKKEILAMYKDALSHNRLYQETLDEFKKVQDKKKLIENETKLEMRADFDKLEILKNELQNDLMLLSDEALSQLMRGETVEVEDSYGNKYEPIFTVKFKKA